MAKKILLITLGAIVLFVLFGYFYVKGKYNGFVKLDEEVKNKWAMVESKYQRRLDLIPNLVNSVKGFMEQEKEVFGKIADARSAMAGAKSMPEKINASNQLESALSRLLVVMENYPQLKSNETVLSLMAELSGTENRISVERDRYNESVKSYNIAIRTFPNNLFASMFGFTNEHQMFKAEEEAAKAPKVQF
ncbi:MAG TPA: LemA family protein [bacterium]|nr:LemA family protein [bacterium]HPN31194.1 LemA family protein [bacterium]